MRQRAKHLFLSLLLLCDMSEEEKRVRPLDLEAVVSHLVWVLETKLVISGKAARALNH